MSQPKHQLQTFKAWAGKSSDISYYLNSHHVDFHEWVMLGKVRQCCLLVCRAACRAACRAVQHLFAELRSAFEAA